MWCLTPSTYSPEPGAESSRTNYSDIELLALSKSRNIPEKFCLQGSLTEAYLDSLFGTTLQHSESTIQTREATSSACEKGIGNSSYVAGSPSFARTSVLPEKVPESLENAPGCGPTWRESLARFDPDSCSWKTVQLSLLGDSELSSVIWPRSGMTADGQCWELPMLGRRIKGTGSGSWPTPCATDASNRQINGQVHVTAGGLPKHIGKSGKLSQMRLSQAVKMWPTPTVCGNHNRKGASATSGDGLATAVRTWPTPIARDCRTVRGGARMKNSLGTEPLITQVAIAEGRTDGALNPQWVEWLMGWPIGHTDLKPSATARCLSVQPQHGECLEAPES